MLWNSREQARRRLAAVVAADRVCFPPGLLDQLRTEVMIVLSRHLEVDHNNADVRLTRSGREVELVASIPVSRYRGEREG